MSSMYEVMFIRVWIKLKKLSIKYSEKIFNQLLVADNSRELCNQLGKLGKLSSGLTNRNGALNSNLDPEKRNTTPRRSEATHN